MTSCATTALNVLNSLNADVRRVIGHEFDNEGLNRADGEVTHSALVRILKAAETGAEIDAMDYDVACTQLAEIRARARGAEDAIRAFGVGDGQSYAETIAMISAARRLNETTGPLDFISIVEGGPTEADITRARARMAEEY